MAKRMDAFPDAGAEVTEITLTLRGPRAELTDIVAAIGTVEDDFGTNVEIVDVSGDDWGV
jgi:hypothetical protein